ARRSEISKGSQSISSATVSIERRISRSTSPFDRNRSWLMMPQPSSEASTTRTPSRSITAHGDADSYHSAGDFRRQRQGAIVRRGDDGDLAGERTGTPPVKRHDHGAEPTRKAFWNADIAWEAKSSA